MWGVVMSGENKKLGFFDYMKLAKEEYQTLLKEYPELDSLSSRELEVFELLLSDKTQSEIADELFVSASAVHFHCKNIYKKLSISSRKQLLIKYKYL